jgi:hypothetical protein
MNWQLSFRLFSFVVVTSTLGAPAALALNAPKAQPTSPSTPFVSLEFPPSRDRGSLDGTVGGGTRSGNSCTSSQGIPLTALMPNSSNVGKTVRDNPTLYWYVPETTATMGEFVLIDEDSNEVYFESFELPDTPGIVSLTLPPQTNLKVGKNYLWYFTLVCNEFDRSRDRYLVGRLDRTELSESVKEEIRQRSPVQQAEIYAKYKIWHETLSIVDQLRLEQPQQWQQLLSSVGLEALVQEDIHSLLDTEEQTDLLTDN